MKEQAPIVAVQPTISYSGRRGDIFVSEAAVETSKRNQPKARPVERNGKVGHGPERQEKAYKAWREHYVKQGKDISGLPADERGVVFTAIKEGLKPQQETTRVKPPMEEVLANSLLSDKDRLTKAEEVLGRTLSEKEKQAVLKAHYYKGDGVGKSGEEAGVYNYTKQQLLQKGRILNDEGGFSKEERRMLIEAGIAAEHVVPPAGVHPALQDIITRINERGTALGARAHDIEYLQRQIAQIDALADAGTIPVAQAIAVNNQLQGFIAETASKGERIGWQLMNADRAMLEAGREKVMEWLELQFNQVYKLAEKGQEINSPQMQNMQQRLQEASTFIINTYNAKEDRYGPEYGTELSRILLDIYNTRLNMLYLKTAIERRNDEQMVGTAIGARTESVAKAMMLDEGRVQLLFNRMNELLEDMRLRDGGLEHHITPEMIERLPHMVKDEQYELAKRGLGFYSDVYTGAVRRVDHHIALRVSHGEVVSAEQRENEIRELTKMQMIRSERAAMDVLVVLQRVSLLNARGDFQRGGDLRRTAPGGGLPFNMLKYKIGPGQKLTSEGEQVLDEMLIYMADDHLRKKGVKNPNSIHRLVRKELGEHLFGVIYEPADFFSSGWRCNSLEKQIGEYIEYKYALRALGVTDEKYTNTVTAEQIAEQKAICRDEAKRTAKNFALFVRLKLAFGDESTAGKPEETKEAWGKIAQYRPEEIMRLFRDRASGEQAFINIFNSEPFRSNISLDGFTFNNELHGVSREQQEATYRYDRFKQKYGFIMGVIRDRAFKAPIPYQVDGANLSMEEQDMINDFLGAGEAEKAKAMYRAMQEGINRNEDRRVSAWLLPGKSHRSMIDALVYDSRFADIYRHTLIVDDTLFGQLEMVNLDPHVTGIIPISKVLANEPGADALVRNFEDIKDANAAQNGLLIFLDDPNVEEKLKGLKAAGDAVYSMNGTDTRVAMYDAGLGTLLDLAKQDFFWNVLNVDKLLFELPSSKLEKILGPHAKPMGRADLLKIINQFSNQITLHAKEERAKDKFLPPEARAKNIEEERKKAERVVEKLKQIAGVMPVDMIKLKTTQGLLFFLLAMLAEAFNLIGAEANPKS